MFDFGVDLIRGYVDKPGREFGQQCLKLQAFFEGFLGLPALFDLPLQVLAGDSQLLFCPGEFRLQCFYMPVRPIGAPPQCLFDLSFTRVFLLKLPALVVGHQNLRGRFCRYSHRFVKLMYADPLHRILLRIGIPFCNPFNRA